MYRSTLLIIFLLFCCLSACQKEDSIDLEKESQTLVFGHFYGECGGERCIEMYKLDLRTKTIGEDTVDIAPNPPHNGSFVPLNDAYYQEAKGLLALFPLKLLNEKELRIGAPDAGDQGGYYVEVTYKGARRYWLIDTRKEDIPAYLHPFVDELRLHIRRLP